MLRDIILYVTRLEQTVIPTEDRTGDPVVPPVTGGEVIVTAQTEGAYLEFGATVAERVAIGDEVHVRIDHVSASA